MLLCHRPTPASVWPNHVLLPLAALHEWAAKPQAATEFKGAAGAEDARMTRQVVDGLPQFVAGQPRDPLTSRRLLGAADLDEKVSAWLDVLARLIDETVEDGEAVRPAVEGDTRLEVADVFRQLRELGMRDVRRIAQDEGEALPGRQGTEQVALQESDAIRNAVPRGVAGRDGQRLGADVDRREACRLVPLGHCDRQAARSRTQVEDVGICLLLRQAQELCQNPLGVVTRDQYRRTD